MTKNLSVIRVFILALILICIFPSMYSCGDLHIKHNGLDYWIDHNEGMSSFTVANAGILMDEEFLETYRYSDGDFYYQYDEMGFFSNILDRAFAWFTYDDEIYQQAKNSCITTDSAALNNGQEVLGYNFYMRQDWDFPQWFSAVGCNDERKTLVFIGFYCSFDFDKKNKDLAKTDFEAFLKEYYGEWYDWDNSTDMQK